MNGIESTFWNLSPQLVETAFVGGRLRTCRDFAFRLMVLWIALAWGPSLGLSQEGEPGIAVRSSGQVSRCWLAGSKPITLNRWLAVECTSIEGEIIEINRKELSYIAKGETQLRRVPGDLVVAIDVAWESDEARKAHEQFQNRDYSNSFESARKAIGTGILKWQQRIMVSEMVLASQSMKKWSASGKVFLTLANQDPPMVHFATIPLIWNHERLDRSAADLAVTWLKEPSEEARLIGASWLLTGGDGGEARLALEDLAKSKRVEISRLATTQLWRLVPAVESVSQRFPEWSAYRDAMPLPLQVGPTLLIADKLDQAGQSILAVPEWLRIATLHRDRYDAVESAVNKAANALRKSGKADEANRIEQLYLLKREQGSAK